MIKRIAILIGSVCLSGHAENLTSFSAELSGANANPPNNSPFVAAAGLNFGTRFVGGGPQWPGTPPTGVLTSNTLAVVVEVPPSALINDLGFTLGLATIEDAAGAVLWNLTTIYLPDDVPGGPGIPVPRYGGFFILSAAQAKDLLAGKWFVHIGAVTSSGADYPAGQIRGRIVRPDADRDGVADDEDECPNTAPGAVVDANGCSIEQLCPCDAEWKNHAKYVNCVRVVTGDFRKARLISEPERRDIIREAEHSDCGRRR